MATLKTKPTANPVESLLEKIEDLQRREDAYTLMALMKKVTKAQGTLWGGSIIGFGQHRLLYESGREIDWFLIGFSPRKQNHVIYFVASYLDKSANLKNLGKFKTGKGCLYINRLSDVDMKVLEQMISDSVKKLK